LKLNGESRKSSNICITVAKWITIHLIDLKDQWRFEVSSLGLGFGFGGFKSLMMRRERVGENHG